MSLIHFQHPHRQEQTTIHQTGRDAGTLEQQYTQQAKQSLESVHIPSSREKSYMKIIGELQNRIIKQRKLLPSKHHNHERVVENVSNMSGRNLKLPPIKIRQTQQPEQGVQEDNNNSRLSTLNPKDISRNHHKKAYAQHSSKNSWESDRYPPMFQEDEDAGLEELESFEQKINSLPRHNFSSMTREESLKLHNRYGYKYLQELKKNPKYPHIRI